MCTPVTTQIKQLLACKEFELALHLAVSRSFMFTLNSYMYVLKSLNQSFHGSLKVFKVVEFFCKF